MKEIWKSVVGYEGQYEVSSLGNVRSLDRYVKTKNGDSERFVKGVLMKPQRVGVGYYQVKIAGKPRYVQQLVAESFLNFRTGTGKEVHHIDYDKSNNSVDNLMVVSRSYNMIDAFKHYGGKTGREYGIKNEKKYCVICSRELSRGTLGDYCIKHREHEKVKLHPDIDVIVKKLVEGESFSSLGRYYGVSDNAIRKWLKSNNKPYRIGDYRS